MKKILTDQSSSELRVRARNELGLAPGRCRNPQAGRLRYKVGGRLMVDRISELRVRAGIVCPILALMVVLFTSFSPISVRAADTNAASTVSATVLPGRNMDLLDDKQKLAVGDTVTFQVFEDQEDPKPLMVTDSGEINVPELGLVQAAGKTCKQLAKEIKEKLEKTTYYHATVSMGIALLNKTLSGRKVFVVGQVRMTGPQEIPAGATWTVSKTILLAGGFTDFADKKHVRLIRGGAKDDPSKMVVVNVEEIWEKADTAKDLPVEPEDLVFVPSRAVNFR